LEISNAVELHRLLTKALQVEMSYEALADWEGYVSVSSPKFRDTLFGLISESGKHETMVKEMIEMVVLPQGASPLPFQQLRFDFGGRSELDVMTELLRYEKLAHDLYASIRAAAGNIGGKGFVSEENLPRFLAVLDQLIMEESDHEQLVSDFIGKVQMIR
jgi:rubrerythrin